MRAPLPAVCPMDVLRASLASLLLALWLEAFYNFGVRQDAANFAGAALVYALVLPPLHLALRRAGPRLWVAVSGLAGLAAEWLVIGNSPRGNPEAIQTAMFVFHGSYPVWGRILVQGGRQARAGLAAVAAFTVAGLAGAALPGELRAAWFLLVPLGLYYLLAAMVLIGRPRG
jgi:hypothetical protein